MISASEIIIGVLRKKENTQFQGGSCKGRSELLKDQQYFQRGERKEECGEGTCTQSMLTGCSKQ